MYFMTTIILYVLGIMLTLGVALQDGSFKTDGPLTWAAIVLWPVTAVAVIVTAIFLKEDVNDDIDYDQHA